MRERYYKAAQHPHYFEEAMLFGSHLFDKPPEPERTAQTAKSLKEQERVAQQAFVERLQAQVGG